MSSNAYVDGSVIVDPVTGATVPCPQPPAQAGGAPSGAQGTTVGATVSRGRLRAIAAHPADNLPDDAAVAVDLSGVDPEVKRQRGIDPQLAYLWYKDQKDLNDTSQFGVTLGQVFGEQNVFHSVPPDDSSVGAEDSASAVAEQQQQQTQQTYWHDGVNPVRHPQRPVGTAVLQTQGLKAPAGLFQSTPGPAPARPHAQQSAGGQMVQTLTGPQWHSTPQEAAQAAPEDVKGPAQAPTHPAPPPAPQPDVWATWGTDPWSQSWQQSAQAQQIEEAQRVAAMAAGKGPSFAGVQEGLPGPGWSSYNSYASKGCNDQSWGGKQSSGARLLGGGPQPPPPPPQEVGKGPEIPPPQTQPWGQPWHPPGSWPAPCGPNLFPAPPAGPSLLQSVGNVVASAATLAAKQVATGAGQVARAVLTPRGSQIPPGGGSNLGVNGAQRGLIQVIPAVPPVNLTSPVAQGGCTGYVQPQAAPQYAWPAGSQRQGGAIFINRHVPGYGGYYDFVPDKTPKRRVDPIGPQGRLVTLSGVSEPIS